MTSLRRVVPEWRYLLPQLEQTLKEQKQRNHDEDEDDEDATMYLDAVPSALFRYSCGQSFLPSLTTLSGLAGMVVVGFQWGHTMSSHRMEVWSENLKGDFRHTMSLPLESGYRVEHLVFVPSHRVFVGACNDLSLRVFSDPSKGMLLQYQARCPGSVLCMHYCRDTGELLTGSMGIITFWGFWTTVQTPLGILRVLDWNSSSLCRDSSVSALLTGKQNLYALCNRGIKTFDHAGQQESQEFRGQGQGSLRCVSPNWVQRYLYTGDMVGFVQVWGQNSRRMLQEFKAHTRSVSTILLRPSTHTLLTSSPDGWVKEWSCSGDLLLKFFLDDPGGVRTLWPLGEHSVLCQSTSSFSVWRLQDLYRLFNDPGCAMQLLRRVECGRGRARLLAVSQDSIPRLISPASGELLLLSWPFLLLEQALAYAYNPGRKELFVASGTPDVLVLDLTLCPCPAKRILCTSKNQDQDDSVMCVEAVMVEGVEETAADTPLYLVFSGHLNGKLQLLSPHRLRCPALKAHGGAILQMSSLSGPRPQLCCYGLDKQLSVWEMEVGEGYVEVVPWARVSAFPGVVFSRLLSGLIFAVSLNHSLLFFSLPGEGCLRMERNPPTTISCLDCCTALGLVAVAGPLGIVEVWESRGTQLAEMRLGTAISQVCFANARGDLLACLGGCICIIPGQRYLPVRLLREVLLMAPVDDLLEDPAPFLPRSQSCYNMATVHRMFLRPGQATPEHGQALLEGGIVEAGEVVSRPDTGRKSIQEVLVRDKMRKSPVRVLTPPSSQGDKSDPWSFALPLFKTVEEEKADLQNEAMVKEGRDYKSSKTTLDSLHLDVLLLDWPVAPDGFLPNSILRSWEPCQEPPEPCKPCKPGGIKKIRALGRTFSQTDEKPEHSLEVEFFKAKAKAHRLTKPIPAAQRCVTPPKEELAAEEEEDHSMPNLLKQISESPWLVKKPDESLAEVLKALMVTMEGMDCGVYDNCSDSLLSLFQAYPIPPQIMQDLTLCLFTHMQKGSPHWKRLSGMRNLEQLKLMDDKDLLMVAEILLDPAMDLRKQAKDILTRVFGIENKATLLSRLQGVEGQELLKQLDKWLSDELDLKNATMPIPKQTVRYLSRASPQTKPRKLDPLDSPDSPKQDQARTPDFPSTQYSQRPLPTVPDACSPKQPRNVPQCPPRTHKKFRKFSLSTRRKLGATEIQEKVYYDPTLIEVYKKTKTPRTKVTSHHMPPPPAQEASTGPLSWDPFVVQVPPTFSSVHICLEPIKAQRDLIKGQRDSIKCQSDSIKCQSDPIPQIDPIDPQRDPIKSQRYPIKSQRDPMKAKRDPNWRESLYKLVSIYGFRSPRASRLTALGPLASHGPSQFLPHTLPPLQARQSSQVSLGQRVVRRIQMMGPTGNPLPSYFHYGVPLPWQLNSHTLDPSGESQYGRLEVDWVRRPMERPTDLHTGQEEMLKLPPISSKCHQT